MVTEERPTEESPHHMGKRTGYRLIDGEYHVAPTYSTAFAETTAQKAGVEAMLAAVTKHATETLAEITKANRRIWDDLTDDIGLDRSLMWVFGSDGVVRKVKEKNDVNES